MTLRKEKYSKVTEYHLPMVLLKYWFKFSLTGLRKKRNYFTQKIFRPSLLKRENLFNALIHPLSAATLLLKAYRQ